MQRSLFGAITLILATLLLGSDDCTQLPTPPEPTTPAILTTPTPQPPGCGPHLLGCQTPDPTSAPESYDVSADTCASCHPHQAAEWRGSIMHYGAVSPVFNAFELTVRQLSDGAVAPDAPAGNQANFCVGCHSPTGDYNGELPDYYADEDRTEINVEGGGAAPLVDNLSPVAAEGLTCTFCHSITDLDTQHSLTGDGIGNRSLEFKPSGTVSGPLDDPDSISFHDAVSDPLFKSSRLCGSCHDVRLHQADVIGQEVGAPGTEFAGQPFQRLENLFTEWETGPYNSTDNPTGRVVECQDCHMSLYPLTDPGCYAQQAVAFSTAGGREIPIGPVDRRHALHAFTAVSIPMFAEADPRFPHVDSDETLSYVAESSAACGDDAQRVIDYPLGQHQRRVQLLERACTLDFGPQTDALLTAEDDHIRIEVIAENVGAGHHVPAGFSQEREVWVEITVEDDDGLIYRSGYLEDSAHPATYESEPDGRLNDEDLHHQEFTFEDVGAIAAFTPEWHRGPDYDQRPFGRNLGLVNFQNRFIICHEGDCWGYQECLAGRCTEELAATWEPTINPLLANHIDNTQSLPELMPISRLYDVPLPTDRPLRGDVYVHIKLNYRTFPPEFLRFLSERSELMEGETLVPESIVDQNQIVVIAEDTLRIPNAR